MRTQPAHLQAQAKTKDNHPVIVAGKVLDKLLAHHANLHSKNPSAFRMASQWTIGNSSRIVLGFARSDEQAKLRNAVMILGGWTQKEEVEPELREAAAKLLQEIRSAQLLPTKQS